MTDQHQKVTAVDRVRRWEEAGGFWRVLTRRSAAVTVSLCRCDGGEEVDRVVSDDPELIGYLGDRADSGS